LLTGIGQIFPEMLVERKGQAAVDVIELSVIPRVKALNAKFQATAARFAECETLEKREVPIVATGTAERVVPQCSEHTLCRRHKRPDGHKGGSTCNRIESKTR